MKKNSLFLALTTLVMTTSAFAAEIGIVDFGRCITETEFGNDEQKAFNAVKTQMENSLEDLQKQLQDVDNKLNDKEHLDSLSPAGVDDLRNIRKTVEADIGRLNGQFYQLYQQANMQVMQKIAQRISQAAETITDENKPRILLNRETCFYADTSYDYTPQIIAEMNRIHSEEKKAAPKAEEDKK